MVTYENLTILDLFVATAKINDMPDNDGQNILLGDAVSLAGFITSAVMVPVGGTLKPLHTVTYCRLGDVEEYLNLRAWNTLVALNHPNLTFAQDTLNSFVRLVNKVEVDSGVAVWMNEHMEPSHAV